MPAPAPPPAQAPAEPFRTTITARSYAFVTGLDPSGDNFLALRTKPATDGTRIATMGPDTLLQVLETRGDWRRVSLLDGTAGWAHGNWIQCCRTIAAARPGLTAPAAVPSAPVSQGDNCDSLWKRRNAIWHRHGYCFTGAKGQQVFGNQGCSRDQAAARAAMSTADRSEVDALDAQEKQLGCR